MLLPLLCRQAWWFLRLAPDERREGYTLRKHLQWIIDWYGDRKPVPSDVPPIAVIVLSHSRVGNIPAIVHHALRLPFVRLVVVSNAHPSLRIRDDVRLQDPRLRLMDRPGLPIERFFIARELMAEGYERFLIIDDDVFLSRSQYAQLAREIALHPEMPHGLVGQILDDDTACLCSTQRQNKPVDVINCTFACTAEHVQRLCTLLPQIGFPDAPSQHRLPFGDDIVLSFSGARHPQCHECGRLTRCATNRKRGIARHRKTGFNEYRLELFRKLTALTGRPPAQTMH